MHHDGSRLFAGLKSPLTVCRYHSLIVCEDSLPPQLVPTAWSQGILMALQHQQLPMFGVQFHPEAILTEGGYPLLANFLRAAGIHTNVDPTTLHQQELAIPKRQQPQLPVGPVTFLKATGRGSGT